MSAQTLNAREQKLWEFLGSKIWRMCNLYMIKDKGGRRVPFTPNRAQLEFFRDMHDGMNVILKARQLGMSTAIVLWILDDCMFNSDFSGGIVDKSLPDATKKMEKVTFAYDCLDHPDMQYAALGALVKQRIQMLKRSWRPVPEVKFSNGSSMYAGTSLRGDTVQRLHISELGKISALEPTKAQEIVAGSMNTCDTTIPGNVIFAESTHEGGRVGVNYEMVKAAQENDPENLSPIDGKFFFFGWHYDDKYTLPPETVSRIKLRREMIDYFAKLEREEGIRLTDGQKAWYDRKDAQQREKMKQEFPSTAEEALMVRQPGSIYGKWMAKARSEGRIRDFPIDPRAPIYVAADVGFADFSSWWWIQPMGEWFYWIDWFEDSKKTPAFYADVIRQKAFEHGQHPQVVFLPHDAGYHQGGTKTYQATLAECGITNTVCLNKVASIWDSINNLRDILPKSIFHKTRCGRPRIDDEKKEHQSGIQCLEAYHTPDPALSAVLKDKPVHDESSHSSQAASYFADAVLVLRAVGPGSATMSPTGEHRVTTTRCAGNRRGSQRKRHAPARRTSTV